MWKTWITGAIPWPEIYNQILEDLQEAENLLKDVERKSQWRADINSVRLLMSRVYLYMCDYANTQKYAAMVIENGPRLENLNGFSGESFLTPELSELIFSMGSTSIFGSVSLDKESSQSSNNFGFQTNYTPPMMRLAGTTCVCSIM